MLFFHDCSPKIKICSRGPRKCRAPDRYGTIAPSIDHAARRCNRAIFLFYHIFFVVKRKGKKYRESKNQRAPENPRPCRRHQNQPKSPPLAKKILTFRVGCGKITKDVKSPVGKRENAHRCRLRIAKLQICTVCITERYFACGEDTHALRLKSELFDLRAEIATVDSPSASPFSPKLRKYDARCCIILRRGIEAVITRRS